MNWSDYDFILDGSDEQPLPPRDLTGWETVVFELDEEESLEE